MDLPAPSLAQVVSVLDELYDPRDAESWDAVGLVCGELDQRVQRVMFTVDPTAAVVDEALAWGADLIVAHHPLLLSAVHGVPASDPRGAVVHRLIKAGVALFTAHTNADVAPHGVSDALAESLGLVDLAPLSPLPAEALDGLATYVPYADAEVLLDALAEAGAGQVGDYSRCAWRVDGRGTFTPQAGANPTIGEIGKAADVGETKLEMVLPRGRRREVLEALRAAHPYEMPAFQLTELAFEPGAKGLGRVGSLPEAVPFEELVRQVGDALPPTTWGVRGSGDLQRMVRRVAVCGGSGGSLIGRAAQVGADAFLTADLRHHVALDALADGAPALVDVAHWASEQPWTLDAALSVRFLLEERGTNVEITASQLRTDPWTIAAPETRLRSSAQA